MRDIDFGRFVDFDGLEKETGLTRASVEFALLAAMPFKRKAQPKKTPKPKRASDMGAHERSVFFGGRVYRVGDKVVSDSGDCAVMYSAHVAAALRAELQDRLSGILDNPAVHDHTASTPLRPRAILDLPRTISMLERDCYKRVFIDKDGQPSQRNTTGGDAPWVPAIQWRRWGRVLRLNNGQWRCRRIDEDNLWVIHSQDIMVVQRLQKD